ncbi:MAG: PilZ domain-containing protein [Acidimicrobiia bacterium]
MTDPTAALARADAVTLTVSTGEEVTCHVLSVTGARVVLQTDERSRVPLTGSATVAFGLRDDASYRVGVTIEGVIGNRVTASLAEEPHRSQLRSNPRQPLRFPARLARRVHSDHWVTAHVRNLSESGVGVLVAELLDRDEVVLFEASIRNVALHCSARVVRRDVSPVVDPFVQYGLAFVELDASQRDALAALLAQR